MRVAEPGRPAPARAAAASASRVLPIPPGPTSVTTGDRGERLVDGLEVLIPADQPTRAVGEIASPCVGPWLLVRRLTDVLGGCPLSAQRSSWSRIQRLQFPQPRAGFNPELFDQMTAGRGRYAASASA